MPKQMIAFWSEKRMVLGLVILSLIIAVIYIPIEISDVVDLPSYNILSVITDDEGLFVFN